MDRESVDALLVVARSSRTPDLAAFVGPIHLGESLVVVPRGGAPRLGFRTDMERGEAGRTGFDLLTPSTLAAEADAGGKGSGAAGIWLAALSGCGVDRGVIGLAGAYPAGALAAATDRLRAAGLEIRDFNGALRTARKRKTASEAIEIERVAAATCAAFRRVAALLAATSIRGADLELEGEQLTAGRLRDEVRAVLAAADLDQPEGNIVSAGRDAAFPHTQGPSDRPLHAAESIVIDLYPKGHLFADCTRTFCVGEPPQELTAAHSDVRDALEAATVGALREAWAPDLQEAACDALEAAGWPTNRSSPGTTRGYVHGLGHGVGYELHELPAFRGSSDDSRLESGDVFTLEPGLYDPEQGFGVRLEDLLVMEEDGPRSLTPLPYDLDPRAW